MRRPAEPTGWRWLCGRHAVEEALRSGNRELRELRLLHEMKGEHVGELARMARSLGARVHWVKRSELDRVAGGASHQGVALLAAERPGEEFDSFLKSLESADRKSLVVVALDQIQDPHNLGAIARSAACLGARGLLLPERRSASVTPAAVQASAGAIERIRVINVGNLAQALERLKESGFWIYGADMGGTPAFRVTFNPPMVLVIGSEGSGLRPLVRERCDELAAIPQDPGGVESLNASCAASVLLYEARRQFEDHRSRTSRTSQTPPAPSGAS